MLSFYENYKKFILPAILAVIYCLFITLTWGKWGNIIADCFREMIIPQALNEGKILYSDITCLYPPLAYQLNALLFRFFGNSLNVLYISGITCSSIILCLLYKLTQNHSSHETAFVTVLSAMGIFTFRILPLNFASWFFPYSYSFLYSFTACFAAFYFYILFFDKQNEKYLYLSALMTGLSVAFKPDFLIFGILPLISALKSKNLRKIFISLTCLVLPFCATFILWFLSGGSFEILAQQKDFLVNFAKTPSVLLFNKLLLVQTINKYTINVLSFSAINFLIQIGVITFFSVITVFITTKIKNLILKNIFILLSFFTGYITIFKNIAISHLKINVHTNLVFLPYFIFAATIIFLFLKNKSKNYTDKDKFYLLTAVSAFLISYRILAALFISYIGNFIAVLYWLTFVFLLLEILPEYCSKLRTNLYKKTVSVILLIYSLTYSILYLSTAANMQSKIKSEKGVYYGGIRTAAFRQAIDYVNKNIPPEKSVLVVDEGTVINYFTDRKTNLKYYALIPHYIDTFGEDKIITDLDRNKPDYIFITNNDYIFIGKFGQNYAKNIMNYIYSKYEATETFKSADNFKITVMKLKN